MFDGILEIVGTSLRAIGAILLVFALLGVTAFVVQALWNWFVSPLGVRHIGIGHAYGLMMLVWLASNGMKNINSDDENATLLSVTLGTLFGLGLAWLLGAAIVAFDPSL